MTTSPGDAINVQWTVATQDDPVNDPKLETYRIWRAPSKIGPWTILVPSTEAAEAAPKTPTVIDLMYLDEDLTAGTQYCYQVAGIDANDKLGLRSDEVCYDTDDAEVPGRPTAVKATPVTADRIDLTWTAPDDPEGAPVTGYEIEYSTDDGTRWNRLTADTEKGGNSSTTAVEASYTDSTVQPEQTRLYRVYALNAAGRSLASSIAGGDGTNATATTPAGTVSTAPGDASGLRGTADTNEQTITLVWTPGENADFHRVAGIRVVDGDYDLDNTIYLPAEAEGSFTVDMSSHDKGTYRFAVVAGRGADIDDDAAEWSKVWAGTEVIY